MPEGAPHRLASGQISGGGAGQPRRNALRHTDEPETVEFFTPHRESSMRIDTAPGKAQTPPQPQPASAANPAMTPARALADPPPQRPRLLAALGLLVLAALLWSGAAPYDRATWLMEVAPVLIVAPVLLATWRRYPLSTLLYALIALHALVLILGGAYTYARVPLGFWLQDIFHLGRNPYDKIGHFMQGLVPAMAAREVLLRARLPEQPGHGGVLVGVRGNGDQRRL